MRHQFSDISVILETLGIRVNLPWLTQKQVEMHVPVLNVHNLTYITFFFYFLGQLRVLLGSNGK